MKKSILILPSIILLFLVNACTPLPTGGPVSANTIYKAYNTLSYSITSGIEGSESTANLDINNDGINDIKVYITANLLVRLASVNNVDFGTNNGAVKAFPLNESIGVSSVFAKNDFYVVNRSFIGAGWVSDIENSFSNPTDKYIGIRYKNGNDYNYGWLRIYIKSILVNNTFLGYQINIVESSFNSLVNQSIQAGKK
jgi:hypothetical protein